MIRRRRKSFEHGKVRPTIKCQCTTSLSIEIFYVAELCEIFQGLGDFICAALYLVAEYICL